ncbi:MAG: mechanosensitive ion channel family protein [Euryarchaeota archaeon]|nr:mechanosensitive ion channel family protein [Euryarchaeota archaeon]MBT6560138.1 mechanosensitive ion channel family protein [Euryarchaeota archaeon]
MVMLVDMLLDRLNGLSWIEFFTFAVNAFVFIFSKNISKLHGEDDKSKTKTRLRTLHSFNLVVFAAFIASLIMNNSAFPDEQISHSSLCLLISYIIYNIADGMILSKYGENISVMGSSRYVETATSRTLELIVLGAVIVTSTITLINIWGITGILETTGALGFLAVLMFTTKDYWLGDFLSGILIVSNNSVKRGDVISIPDMDIMGIVMEIGGLQTRIRDLVQGHDIEVPNTSILSNRTDFFKLNHGGPLKDFVDFNISYGIATEIINNYLQKVYDTAKENIDGLNESRKPIISLKENSNNAVRWRLTYYVERPYRVLKIRDTINLAAYNLQDEFGIDLSTPQLESSVKK